MIVEGKGMVAPVVRRKPITQGDFRAILAGVEEIDRYRLRRDTWGRGLCAALTLPGFGVITSSKRAILAGKIGEYGVYTFLHEKFGDAIPPVDFSRRPRGDGGIDLQAFGLRMQLKTRQRQESCSLIRRFDNGKWLPLAGDVHVFCQWDCTKSSEIDWVSLLGWLPNNLIARFPLVPARRGTHKNIEVQDIQLRPMSRLLAEIESRREPIAW